MAQAAVLSEQLDAISARATRRWRPLRRFLQMRTGVLGAVLLILLVVPVATAPWLAPHAPNQADFQHVLSGPTSSHWLGTDQLGRDLLSRLMYGGRISLSLSVVIVALAAVIGSSLGAIAGYWQGPAGTLLLRLADVLLAFPGLLLALAIASTLGNGIGPVIVAAITVSVPIYLRLVRGAVLVVVALPYIESARTMGASEGRILLQHVMPNVLTPILVQCSVQLAGVLLLISSLSFLGIGVQPPTPEWGVIVSDGRAYLHAAAYLSAFGGLTIMLAVLGFNLLGDGLRDALDVRQAG
jgi:ABC-type dipeptide/oligopeptide/nickel transport system permease subunit